MADDDTATLLREIRDLQREQLDVARQALNNQTQALANQSQAMANQAQAIKRQQEDRATLAKAKKWALVVFWVIIAFAAFYLLQPFVFLLLAARQHG